MTRMRIAALAGLVASAAIVVTLVATLGAQPQARFNLNRTFTPPAQAGPQVVYRLVPLFKTPEEVRSRALQVGLQPQAIRSMTTAGASYTIKDPTWTLTLDTDRQLETLMDNQVLVNRYGPGRVVPDEAECRKVALSYLGQKNLVEGTGDEALIYERTNELLRSYRGVADKGPGAPPVLVMREVVFAKTIRGVPCTGPGTHLSVFVGHLGKVQGYVSNWMPAVATSERTEVEEPLTNFDLLRRELVDLDNGIGDDRTRFAQADIQRCRYVLVTARDRNGELIALPGFEYRGQITDRQQRAQQFTRAIMAPRDRRSLLQRVPALNAVSTSLNEVPAPGLDKVAPIRGLQQPFRQLPRGGGRILNNPR